MLHGVDPNTIRYQVEYTSTAGGHYQLLDRVPVANRESCVINGLWPATQYMFRVRAVRADGPDEWRNNWSRHFCTAAGTPAQKVRRSCLRPLPFDAIHTFSHATRAHVCAIVCLGRLTCFAKSLRSRKSHSDPQIRRVLP